MNNKIDLSKLIMIEFQIVRDILNGDMEEKIKNREKINLIKYFTITYGKIYSSTLLKSHYNLVSYE
jgi:hypothetical protein